MAKDVKIEDIAQDVNKITDEELKLVQEKVGKINQVQMTVGGLEAQKHIALHQITNLQEELQVVQKTLEDKYGKVSVNLQTGEITEIPEDETDKKD
tara:strand:- start:946 stop:1233 length:288 start_codon:yes stop_codon:yes gene_type:complete